MKKKSPIKKFMIFKMIINVVVVVFLLLYVSVVLLQRMSGNQSVSGYRIFNVATASMVPVYNVNDIILVKEVKANALKVGDDIAYRGTKKALKGKIITHRIVKIEYVDNKISIVTKGVSNEIEDPPIDETQILGKALGKIPVVSFINRSITTQLGFFLIVFCPIVIIVSMEIAESILENKLEKKRTH